jgi:hypothetical protein
LLSVWYKIFKSLKRKGNYKAMKKSIILATAFSWIATGIHGAEEEPRNPYEGGSYNPGGSSHVKSEESKSPPPQESASEKNLAIDLKKFIEDAVKETNRLEEKHKDMTAGGDHPSQHGFKDDYPFAEVHGKLAELIGILNDLKKISKEYS